MSKAKCKHCKNKKNKTVMVQCEIDNSIYFCCNGCKRVHFLLNDNNKDKEDIEKSKENFIFKLKRIILDKLKR